MTETLPLTSIAESIVGPVDWQDSFVGYVEKCPGEHLHTNRNGHRDCQIIMDGAPTIFCFHTSCAGFVDDANHRLRSAIGKAERGGFGPDNPWRPSPEDIARRNEKERAEKLKGKAKASLAKILAQFQVAEPDLWEVSPVRLDGDIKDEWRAHLGLFAPDDVVWIGDVFDSGKPEHQRKFRPVSEWLKERKCPGNFTCGSTFKPGTYSRSNENVEKRPYLVIESDTLNRGQMLSVTAWAQQFMRLRAILFTGGKSLHSWFDYPDESAIAKLKLILPELGCDPALFKPAQPCRLAGAWREDKSNFQHLLYLDPKS